MDTRTDSQEHAQRGASKEPWQSDTAKHGRQVFGWGLALWVVALIVLPIVAKYFHWF